ncbi:hypothetical protein [Lactiplantibacillus plajomi]|uniref:Integral membrane protein n=1 Tax=Lactiplantibacillus plajomi TaxID=1457217 RepID=A0ABV6K2F6_9LACO|nr:hypothetical protein [Lactiplantibacillus plajomi]
MDISDWFDFNNRVKHDMTLVKEVNGQVVTKHVKGSINWLAIIFTFFYALFSQKYKTKDFLKKTAIPFVALIVLNGLIQVIFGSTIGTIINFAGAIWYGLMFDTWFRNQLLANGYHVDNQAQANATANQNFE